MSTESYLKKLNRVAKWRTVFASWQLGTRSDKDGECKAVKHHREMTIITRVELTGLANLLIAKGVISSIDLENAIGDSSDRLNSDFEQFFPGFHVTEYGVNMIPASQALKTMKDKGFPK